MSPIIEEVVDFKNAYYEKKESRLRITGLRTEIKEKLYVANQDKFHRG